MLYLLIAQLRRHIAHSMSQQFTRQAVYSMSHQFTRHTAYSMFHQLFSCIITAIFISLYACLRILGLYAGMYECSIQNYIAYYRHKTK